MSETNRQIVLTTRPEGRQVEASDFSLIDTPIPQPEDGQVLVRNLYLSFDPTQRGWLNDVPSYLPPVKIGEVMRAGAVAEVVSSKHPDYAAGDWVQGTFGWQDYALSQGGGVTPLSKIPAGTPLTHPLHIYGITGLTAYFGLIEVGQPKPGDIVVISGAAGATGSVAGQIAKLKGAKTVIGIAGGPEKCAWLTQQAGFDYAIDYKNESVAQRLKTLCPNQIDIYFDNVGGAILDAALLNLAQKARVVLCGGISSGYGTVSSPGPANYMQLVIRSCRMEGFLVLSYSKQFDQAISQLQDWVNNGDIIFQEDIQLGLENAPATLRRLFDGKNIGKQLLKIAEPSC